MGKSTVTKDRPKKRRVADSPGGWEHPQGSERFISVVKGAGDEELIGRVAEEDEQALSELYDRYSRVVYATGLRLLGDASLAEELVQDAFTNVWRGAASFDPQRATFATWLYRLTRNRAVDLNRRRRARPLSVGEEPLRNVTGGPEPEASVDLWDVAQALTRISDDHRELLKLAYFKGLSQREISRRTGVPLGTIKSRTTSALKQLRRAMGDNTIVDEARRD
jgi:RNA polymerase sigma-70 factor (ECF subfamily)